MNRCTFLVPDHTDHIECGQEALRANRCPEHLQYEVTDLRKAIDAAKYDIALWQHRLDELQTESG